MKRIIQVWLMCVVVVSITACSSNRYSNDVSQRRTNSDILPGKPYTLSEVEMATVKRGVQKRMKDPDSARFGRMIASRRIKEDGSDVTIVCGFVNGRNSFGGYVGEQPFLGMLMLVPDVTNSFVVISGMSAKSSDRRVTFDMCSRLGAPLF